MTTESYHHLEQTIQGILEDDIVPIEVHRSAVDRLNEHEDLRQQLRRPDAFRKFLQNYVQEQLAAFQGEAGDRDEPLCTCDHAACELKRGILPGRVRRADSLDEGIDEYQAVHPDAVILVEARERWTEMHAEYRNALREIKLDLRDGLEQTAGSARPEAD